METKGRLIMYQIRIKGHMDKHRLGCFESLTVSHQQNGETVITGEMDQSALHGVLNRIRDLGVELISVHRLVS